MLSECVLIWNTDESGGRWLKLKLNLKVTRIRRLLLISIPRLNPQLQSPLFLVIAENDDDYLIKLDMLSRLNKIHYLFSLYIWFRGLIFLVFNNVFIYSLEFSCIDTMYLPHIHLSHLRSNSSWFVSTHIPNSHLIHMYPSESANAICKCMDILPITWLPGESDIPFPSIHQLPKTLQQDKCVLESPSSSMLKF